MRLEWACCGLSALVLVWGCGSPKSTDFLGSPAHVGLSSGGTAGHGGGGTSAAGGAGGNAASGGSSMAGTTSNGGAAGSSASGGTSGTSGNIGDTSTFTDNEEPIDDMEDGDSQILVQSGRDGYWFIISDGTGWTTPSGAFTVGWNLQSRGKSTRSSELMGGNFTDWGAGMAFSYVNGDNSPSYSVVNYSGISFYGRSGQGSVDVNVRFPDLNTNPVGGICGPSPKPACYNDFQSQVTLNPQWQKYQIPFSSLTQGTGTAATFSKAATYGIEFMTRGESDFDIFIDDIAFTKN